VKSFLASVGLPVVRAPALPQVAAPLRDWRATAARLLVSPHLHAGLLGVGIALRVARYVSDRSLWLDESYLALNLMNRSYSGLLNTLDFGQGAPPGFLLAEKLALDVLGDSERALRVVPLAAGISSLFLFYGVARRLLTPVAVPLALLVFAVGKPFIVYSAELKQYGIDIAATLALLYVFLRTVERPQFEMRSALILAVSGAAAVWFSHAAVFVLVGVGAGAVLTMLLRGNRRGLAMLSVPFGVWLLSFFAMYVATLRGIDHVEAATRKATTSTGTPFRNLYQLFTDLDLLHWSTSGLAPAMVLLGAAAMWATPRGRGRLAVGGGLLAALLAANALGKYPLGHRFILFLLPLAVLCLAEGVVTVVRALPRGLGAAFAVLLAGSALLTVTRATTELIQPPEREEIKPVLAYVGDRWQAGDTLYVFGSSQYALRYYLDCSDCPDVVPPRLRAALRVRPDQGQVQRAPALISQSPQIVIGRQKREFYLADLERLRGRERVWLLFSHYFPRSKSSMVEPIGRVGHELACSPKYGVAFACLYDFSRRSA
jgi:hypothetical protein